MPFLALCVHTVTPRDHHALQELADNTLIHTPSDLPFIDMYMPIWRALEGFSNHNTAIRKKQVSDEFIWCLGLSLPLFEIE